MLRSFTRRRPPRLVRRPCNHPFYSFRYARAQSYSLWRSGSMDPHNNINACLDTKTVFIDPDDVMRFDAEFELPVQLLRAGELVAFPTETVYGLGANALNPDAVKKIYAAKNRPMDNPLIVHISHVDMLKDLVSEIPPTARQLMDRFWPGPLTILFKKNPQVSDAVTCGQPTVAVRMPSHPIAKRLIELSNLPIAAPSANLSGRPSPTEAEHVLHDLSGRIKCIIDGGSCDIGVESTVVDIHRDPPLILRPGGVTLEQLREIIPTMDVFSEALDKTGEMVQKPATPGLKYRHYSPQGHMTLFTGTPAAMCEAIIAGARQALDAGEKVGIICTHSSIQYPADLINDERVFFVRLGSENSPLEIARGLFKTLRLFDKFGANVIFMEGIEEKDEGLAVMNRARKAAAVTVNV